MDINYHNDILNLVKRVLENEPKLKQIQVQTFASGLLKYYAEIYGIENITDNIIKQLTHRTAVATINNIYNMITEADNK